MSVPLAVKTFNIHMNLSDTIDICFITLLKEYGKEIPSSDTSLFKKSYFDA